MKENIKTDVAVFITAKESTCSECGENLGSGAWIYVNEKREAFCLSCADMDHLEFLPVGDTALTRRAKQYSSLYAVVLQWKRSRKRYERQGLLVEPAALEKAEMECLQDVDVRARRREREAGRREVVDEKFIEAFARQIRVSYPNCPPNLEGVIAAHACAKYSGRVGRTASAKNFDEKAINLAVIAHIRHTATNYDELLSKGMDRGDARDLIKSKVDYILSQWR